MTICVADYTSISQPRMHNRSPLSAGVQAYFAAAHK